jgi:hypothetical protein
MRILYAGTLELGGTSIARMESMRALGHEVVTVDFNAASLSDGEVLLSKIAHRLRRPIDWGKANAAVIRSIREEPFDVLWIDKGLVIRPLTLKIVRQMRPDLRIAGYSADDMSARHNTSDYFDECLPLYDVFFTNKTYNVQELTAAGCPRVVFNGNGFDPNLHRPILLTPEDQEIFGADVGFVGTYEAERADYMLFLESHGVPVRIFGNDWEQCTRRREFSIPIRPGLLGDDYAKAICGAKINLGFLRKQNRDRQTTRSIEIPACNSFMLAERTDEHRALFDEGKEAEFFASRDELLGKARHYLAHPDERQRIADAGRRRCLESGYSFVDRMREALAAV